MWIPDFVTGAGGIIHTLAREIDHLDQAAAAERVEGIEATVSRLLAAAVANGSTPLHEAMALSNRRLTA